MKRLLILAALCVTGCSRQPEPVSDNLPDFLHATYSVESLLSEAELSNPGYDAFDFIYLMATPAEWPGIDFDLPRDEIVALADSFDYTRAGGHMPLVPQMVRKAHDAGAKILLCFGGQKEFLPFLEKPERYEAIGAKLPRGALLVGPPGTGKTLLAKAVAGEAGVPFFSISGSEFVEMFVGRGAAKVRDLFKQAKEKAPCIVVLDEIDPIGQKRDGGGFSGNDEREQTLNQLLTEMDGFDNKKGIVVLAATNRPDSLDPALLRPGRFDRRVPVELPDLTGRKAILELHLKDVKVQQPVDMSAIARATPGASGADLANIINEGALRAVRMGRKLACQEDFEESVEVVIAGQQRKSTVLSDHEKQVVSYHEIGHAIVAASQTGSAPVTKITIVPRTSGALGYTMQVEQDEKFLTTKQEVLNKLAVYCGGRAAEELIFGEMTTGAANDIEQATKLARNMITRFGMSDEFGMMALGTVQNAYLNQDTSLTCAPGTAERVDEAVLKLITEAHERALQILRENKFKLHELARYLYKKETITGEEFMTLMRRENPFMPPKPAE